jgi:methylphosphotriester-DNA--protein-cysteine methyltransferase
VAVTQSIQAVYVNKDSGIFHRRNCPKIAHLLVGKELIEFPSPEEASKAGNSPCEACKP